MSTCVVVPSRGRPAAAVDLAREFYRTCVRDDTYVIFGVDDDDLAVDEYHERLAGKPNVFVESNPRLRMGPTLNLIATRVAPHHDIVGFMGDDHRPRTIGWDQRVHNALAGGTGVAYGDDKIHGAGLPTAVFMTSNLITTLGYMAPIGLIHLYLDNFWLELGRATRLEYMPDVVIEHMHPIAGKAAWDDGYAECNSDQVTQHDAAEFQRYMREEWPSERVKL